MLERTVIRKMNSMLPILNFCRSFTILIAALVFLSSSQTGKAFSQTIILGKRNPDFGNQAVSPLAIENSTIETIAGIPEDSGFDGDGIQATNSRLNTPQDVAFFPDGDLLIADMNNHRVRRLDLSTGIITTFAGNGFNGVTGNTRFATQAALAQPRGLAVDALGNVYISTLHQIRRVAPNGIIDLYAGSTLGDAGDNIPAREAQFQTLGGLTIDPTNGNLLVADILNHKVRQITPDGIVTTLAGTGVLGGEGDGGPSHLAQLFSPVDVKVDPFGTIYIAERLGNRIRMIRDGVINTIYDSTINPRFNKPRGLAVLDDIFLYFSADDHYIRRYNRFDNLIEPIAGTGMGGFSGDGGPPETASLNAPVRLAIDMDQNLYIADSKNHVIRRINIPPHNIAPTPTPTLTPTPTVIPTFAPTSTPTRTPRQQRTPSPTPTPYPTATPTPTPTALPGGQLAPPILPGQSTSPNFTFFTNRQVLDVPNDPNEGTIKIVLSSTADGTGQLSTQDTIALSVQHPSGSVLHATKTFVNLAEPQDPWDITQLFEKGRNAVTVRLIDSKGTEFSSTALYLVVFTAPVIRDLPDIRVLVEEEAENVYNLNDYVYDRDTPVEDIAWSIETELDIPEVTLEMDDSISVNAGDEVLETQFRVWASDNIFDVSEDVKIKVSTFRVNEFVLQDAPLVADFAYISPYSLRGMLQPLGVNVADVPFETTFAIDIGLKEALVARGEVFLFPEFPGGTVDQPEKISILGKRESNPDDLDAAVLSTSSVVPPGDGDAERNYNFTAENFNQTNWSVREVNPAVYQPGEVKLDFIPPEPVTFITDGYGASFSVEPGEAIRLVSDRLDLPPGPTKISVWYAVEKLDGNSDDVPTVWLGLAEDSNNISYIKVGGSEILGESRYQYLCTYYDVKEPNVYALIQVVGSHSSGRAEVFVDNVRVFPAKRDIDQALGVTDLPVDFDGTFESNIKNLGVLFEEIPFGGRAGITSRANRTIIPGGFKQSMILELAKESHSAVHVLVGPNPVEEELFPRVLTARAYVQSLDETGGVFGIGITNGNVETATYVSNDRFPNDPDWMQVSAGGLFSQPGVMEPLIIIENRNTAGLFPGIIVDGATLAVDDITFEAFQDTPLMWDHKQIPDKLRLK